MKAETVIACFQGRRAPGQRSSPKSPAEGGRLRGDHDLSPELYDVSRPLRRAAVLVPLVQREQGLQILLTKRSDRLAEHAGQISFPGGRIEPEDRDAEAAALRETKEEIGLDAARIRLIGHLDTYLVRTGFRVYPVVGLVRPPFELILDSNEVDEVFEVPLSFFLHPGAKQRHSRMFLGKERHFFAYPYGSYYIWGATAGMLGNLAEILDPELANRIC